MQTIDQKIIPPTDFLNKEIKIGDEVVFVQKGYRTLMKGKIRKISDRMLIIDHEKTNDGRTETRQFRKQVVKI